MPELTIASYNVHWGRRRRALRFEPYDLVEACRQLDADVLVLQESWAPDGEPADHQRVADALGMTVVADARLARAVVDPNPRVVARGPDIDDQGTGGWHLAALSRLPVREPSVVRLPHLWFDHADRAVVGFDVEAEGAWLAVRGTHLPHLEYGAHLATRGLRRALPTTAAPGAFIGDMNMWGWTIDRMVPTGWRRVVHGRTWPSHRPHSQIDHLLVTPAVQAVWAEVGPDLGSDHLPIRARLRWG